MSDCLFCKIANKEIPVKLVFENDYAVAFEDIKPVAPVHILLIPKTHYSSIADVNDEAVLGKLFILVNQIANQYNLHKGYRVVVNKGDDGGQTVHHLHIHIIGSRFMTWPPG